MQNRQDITRRLIVGAIGLAPLTPAMALPEDRRIARTPRLTAGPFYPREFGEDIDEDLSKFGTSKCIASGEIVDIEGRIHAESGVPIAGARVEIWQCDNNGVYHYTKNLGKGADPFFQGYGRTITNSAGLYRFRTIKPVPYPGRTPHIHFKVSPPSGQALTTQMFSADHEAQNWRDGLFRSLSKTEQDKLTASFRRSVRVAGGRPISRGVFDITIADSV